MWSLGLAGLDLAVGELSGVLVALATAQVDGALDLLLALFQVDEVEENCGEEEEGRKHEDGPAQVGAVLVLIDGGKDERGRPDQELGVGDLDAEEGRLAAAGSTACRMVCLDQNRRLSEFRYQCDNNMLMTCTRCMEFSYRI